MSKEKPSKEMLKEALDEAEWSWLKPHLERDALILVASELNMLEVGNAVVIDASQRVQEWIQNGLLAKPSPKQVEAWNATPAKRFMSLVVQPYVLIQEIFLN